MAKSRGKHEKSTQGIALPVERNVPESIVSHYSNFVLVTGGEYEFYLSFFEAEPPAIDGSPEQMKSQMEKLTAVQAKCVARIVVPRDLMPRIVEAINAASGVGPKTDRDPNSKGGNKT